MVDLALWIAFASATTAAVIRTGSLAHKKFRTHVSYSDACMGVPNAKIEVGKIITKDGLSLEVPEKAPETSKENATEWCVYELSSKNDFNTLIQSVRQQIFYYKKTANGMVEVEEKDCTHVAWPAQDSNV